MYLEHDVRTYIAQGLCCILIISLYCIYMCNTQLQLCFKGAMLSCMYVITIAATCTIHCINNIQQ